MPTISKLLQRVSGKKELTVNLVPQRFLQVFREHGVEASQIPRIFPQTSLDDLKNPDSLLKKLTPAVLDEVSELFGIRSEWLEGVDDDIYQFKWCYKNPEHFFEHIADLTLKRNGFPVRVLSTTKNIDGSDDRQQWLVLVIVEKIAELGERIINRYHVYYDSWDWGYEPSRIQLKAMTRLVHQAFGPVPILIVSPEELESIREGRLFPRKYLGGCLITDPSLEDFALDKNESAVAKEVEELPLVMKYIEDYQLKILPSRHPNKGELAVGSEASPNESLSRHKEKISQKSRKAAQTKNASGNQIKDQFIRQIAKRLNEKGFNASAETRLFYDALDESVAIKLFRSETDYKKLTADEARLNAVRTLTTALAKYKKERNQ